MTRPPTKFSKTPARITRHAPRLGENSREILKEAGFDEGEIATLIGRGRVRAL